MIGLSVPLTHRFMLVTMGARPVHHGAVSVPCPDCLCYHKVNASHPWRSLGNISVRTSLLSHVTHKPCCSAIRRKTQPQNCRGSRCYGFQRKPHPLDVDSLSDAIAALLILIWGTGFKLSLGSVLIQSSNEKVRHIIRLPPPTTNNGYRYV